jgi:hypothetical protein
VRFLVFHRSILNIAVIKFSTEHLFILDGEQKEDSFSDDKSTTKTNPNSVVSAYKDNCAFVQGPVVEQFAPAHRTNLIFSTITDYESVLSIKAETHNFPTTVEPLMEHQPEQEAKSGTGLQVAKGLALLPELQYI